MALAPSIIDRVRDEIGPDLDVTDETPEGPLGDLETIYNDADRGNFSTLRTAYIVWKRRLAAMNARAFDATAGGSLMARTQRVRFIERRVKELEILVDTTDRGKNAALNSDYAKAQREGDGEF